MSREAARLTKLRDNLQLMLVDGLDDVVLNGHPTQRLPGHLNVLIPGVESEALMIGLLGSLAISSGSACTTTRVEPSHVLRALGRSDDECHRSIRVCVGRPTTAEDIEYAARRIVEEASRIRALTHH
jgi:cysteine desulfurase